MIDTPFENINKVTLDASLNFQNNVEMYIAANFANTVNSFRFNLDKENRKFISIVESPYVPTGMAEAEAMLTGNTKNMQMKMALKNAEDTSSLESSTLRSNLQECQYQPQDSYAIQGLQEDELRCPLP
nr:uncharacterized protein LOC113813406 [Penaeus vannamei]